jgi:hypothetical protein
MTLRAVTSGYVLDIVISSSWGRVHDIAFVLTVMLLPNIEPSMVPQGQ